MGRIFSEKNIYWRGANAAGTLRGRRQTVSCDWVFRAIAVFWVMGFCAVAWAGAARPNYSAVLAKDSFFPKAVTQFTCKDTVYLQFQWQGLEEGDHSLMALWFNPQGENVDEFRQSFIAVKGGNVQNWVALKFTNIHKKNGIFGFGESPLVGRWTVKYFLDGDFLDEKTFTVACD